MPPSPRTGWLWRLGPPAAAAMREVRAGVPWEAGVTEAMAEPGERGLHPAAPLGTFLNESLCQSAFCCVTSQPKTEWLKASHYLSTILRVGNACGLRAWSCCPACVCSRCAAAVAREAAGPCEAALLGCLDAWTVLTYGHVSPAGLLRLLLIGVAEGFLGKTRYGRPQVTGAFSASPGNLAALGCAESGVIC